MEPEGSAAVVGGKCGLMDGHHSGTGILLGRGGYSSGVLPWGLQDVAPKGEGCQPLCVLPCDWLGQVLKRNGIAHHRQS